MSQPPKSFVPFRPDDASVIVAPYTQCQVPGCPLAGYAYTFSYGQTGKVKLPVCEKHRDTVAAAVWAADQLGLIADSQGGCAHAQKVAVGQLGQRQMLACQQCGTLFLGEGS